MHLRYLPTIRHKYFDTLAHSLVSTLHLMLNRVDAALYCNGANALFTFLPRIVGTPTALNVDGLERKRKKWNRLAKAWYRMSEWLSTFCPTQVVTDARSIQAYYEQEWRQPSVFIPYGAPLGKLSQDDIVRGLGLRPGDYFLYVTRMEPENNPLLVRLAFERTSTELQLALIGDAPYAHDYIRKVRNTRDPRVVIPGAIYGDGYHQLGSHCFAYIHATEVGGTHPALIEAMGKGALVLYLDTEENAEVAGDAGIPFRNSIDDLQSAIERVLRMSDAERDAYRARAMDRVRERYSWDAVTTQYERLLTALARR